KKVDPVHAANYDERAKAYTTELEKLRDEGRSALKGKKIKVVSFHGALGYFARTFGLEIVDTLQAVAERDLAPGELKTVAERCAKEGVSIIAIEPQFPQSQHIAEDVARQVQNLGKPAPKIITIDPLETAEANELKADWYVRKMRENIQQLADAVK